MAETLRMNCPHCDAGFKFPAIKSGRKARCPACGKTIKLESAEPKTVVPASPQDNPANGLKSELENVKVDGLAAPVERSPAPSVETRAAPASDRIEKPSRVHLLRYAIVAVVFILIGYFAGREHLKYEMRSALQSAFGELGNADSPAEVFNPLESDEPKNPVVRPGESFSNDEIRLRISSVTVGKVPLMNLGESGHSQDELLQVKFEIENSHARKILRFNDTVIGSRFTLVDDVGNQIRSVNFGFTATVVGALDGNEDILPGQTVTHIEVFSKPPENTEWLECTVDLESFGLEGKTPFKIHSWQ